MTALLVGTALAVASLCYVLYPLFREAPASPAEMRARGAPVCPRCGPRTEPDAEFCSSCGGALFG